MWVPSRADPQPHPHVLSSPPAPPLPVPRIDTKQDPSPKHMLRSDGRAPSASGAGRILARGLWSAGEPAWGTSAGGAQATSSHTHFPRAHTHFGLNRRGLDFAISLILQPPVNHPSGSGASVPFPGDTARALYKVKPLE